MKRLAPLTILLFTFLLSCSDDNNGNTRQNTAPTTVLATQADVDAFAVMGYSDIEGDLTIGVVGGQSDISDISGLNSLTKVSGFIKIAGTHLTTLEGLENITKANALSLGDNEMLTTLENLDSLEQLNVFSMAQCDAVTSLNGLESLTALESIEIQGNDGLNSLQALNNLTSLRYLTITACNALTSLHGLEGLDNIYSILLRWNNGLLTLKGLDNLSVTNSLVIDGNNALASIEHLSSLTDLANTTFFSMYPRLVGITLNNSLTSLHGLENFNPSNTVAASFSVVGNASLQDFCAITSLMQPVSQMQFQIQDNGNPATVQDIQNGNCN